MQTTLNAKSVKFVQICTLKNVSKLINYLKRKPYEKRP